MDLIDLHAHTTASDGSFSPTELVEEAARIGLSALAVTDHDTVEGLAEARAAGKRLGVEIVPGVELSVTHPKPGHMHLLGYFIDPDNPLLAETLGKIVNGRNDRNVKIVARLNELGLTVTLAEIEAIAQRGNTGRPHISQSLVNRGYVKSLQEAFDKYLDKGQPAYFDRFRLSPEEAIEVVHAAGGKAVLAHPIFTELRGPKLKARLESLARAGLDGLEVFYPGQEGPFTEELLALARAFDLAPTGGSDFHGLYKPDIRLGFGRGSLQVRRELLEALRA